MVTRVVGTIWSVHVVCHRAVQIMCRSMIVTITTMLGSPELLCESGTELIRLLKPGKQRWSGCVIWTWAAQREFNFWKVVP